MKKIIILFIGVVIIVIGVALYFINKTVPEPTPNEQQTTNTSTTTTQTNLQNTATSTVIGKSVQGRNITAYSYGTGTKEVLFIGGIHGGYEWNTVLLAYQAMDYFKENLKTIPSDVRVTIIPVLNPDGLYKTVGTDGVFPVASVPASKELQIAGRFNANKVDLGRNFDCDWKSNAVWQNTPVSGGKTVFSEPESLAIKNYVENNKFSAIVTWYSAVGGVFSSSCHNGVSVETKAITKQYAEASGYPASESFDFYAITGDMVNWFAKQNIPAISVLLTNHTDVEWNKNKAGIDAVLKYYSK